MRLAVLAAISALPLLLAACSQEAADEAEAPVEEAAAPAENATLDLQATGIVVPPQGGFEELTVPFGSMRAATEATLGNVLGEVTGSYDGQGDCWLESTQYEGLSLQFKDDLFVGYSAEAPYVPELSRSEMLADPGVALVEDSTLGEEFTIGSGEAIISGIFAGEGDDAAVESLWAGEVCTFR
ncbi:MAG: hypothetical protein JY451_13230 [Erythrobacter sp.]|nr:MAG: hypothetical protein JY451_13230 [Erythrobacter sp.]